MDWNCPDSLNNVYNIRKHKLKFLTFVKFEKNAALIKSKYVLLKYHDKKLSN